MLAERKRATVFVALIFLCGLLSGAVGANLWRKMTVSADAGRPVPHSGQSSADNHKRVVDWFNKKLNLTSDQTEQLSKILDETRSEYHQQEMQIESIRQESDTRIRALLSDPQKILFDQLLRDRANSNDEKRKNDHH